jgi:signal transduction histidine kinase/HAMP domain-containing protein
MARFCSIRTWFAATLVAVSLLTAGAIALYVVPTTDDQYRDLAQDAALGVTARAAHDVSDASTSAGVNRALARASRNGQLSLWLVDKRGRVVAASALPSVSLRSLPDVSRAISVALARGRFVPTGKGTASHVVALPTRTRNGAPAALVAYAPRAGFAERASDAMRRRFILGTLIAMTLAIVVSLAVATLVSRRVRRLAVAARTIAGGDFNEPVNDRFPDDIGRLAESIDEMRERLAVAFAVVERERGSLSAVLNRLEEGVIALDSTGLVEIVNPAASDLIGATIEPGRRLEPWPAAVLVGNAGSGATPSGAEIETPRGRWLRVQRVALRAGDDHGSILVVVSDRTAERNREASEQRFLANASHELRTPLAAIVAAVEVLQGGAKDEVAARDAFLTDLQHEAHRLQRLTDRLLTVARLGSETLEPSLQPVALASRLAYIAELMQPLAETGTVTIATEGDAPALADPDLLDQVLVGLVGNALKHTPAGGTIRLVADNDDSGPSITVLDTGEGIAESELPHVFDRFWRSDDARSAGGYGLGLGICREHVEAMQGTITIRSRLGAGTSVKISLTRIHAAAALEAQT